MVLVLSGDHIYKMDYDRMISFHTENQADLTIAGASVTPEEASRFGILETDDSYRVIGFEEKPAMPKSHLASMGIYVFNTEVLSDALKADAADPGSSHDFGKNIVPRLLHQCRVFAYPFSGYWVDVGTIQAYWEAHMALLDDNPPLDLNDRGWIIHTRSEERPPVNIRTGALVLHSLITDGCLIEGTVEYSVLSPGVHVERGAVVRRSIVMGDSVIRAGAMVDHTILDKNVEVGVGAHVGFGADYTPSRVTDLSSGLTLVGKSSIIPPNIKIGRNCIIASDMRPQDFTTNDVPSGTVIGLVAGE